MPPRGLADYAARLAPGFFEFVKQGEPAQPWSADVISKAHDECRSRVAESELPARQACATAASCPGAHLDQARNEIGS